MVEGPLARDGRVRDRKLTVALDHSAQLVECHSASELAGETTVLSHFRMNLCAEGVWSNL